MPITDPFQTNRAHFRWALMHPLVQATSFKTNPRVANGFGCLPDLHVRALFPFLLHVLRLDGALAVANGFICCLTMNSRGRRLRSAPTRRSSALVAGVSDDPRLHEDPCGCEKLWLSTSMTGAVSCWFLREEKKDYSFLFLLLLWLIVPVGDLLGLFGCGFGRHGYRWGDRAVAVNSSSSRWSAVEQTPVGSLNCHLGAQNGWPDL